MLAAPFAALPVMIASFLMRRNIRKRKPGRGEELLYAAAGNTLLAFGTALVSPALLSLPAIAATAAGLTWMFSRTPGKGEEGTEPHKGCTESRTGTSNGKGHTGSASEIVLEERNGVWEAVNR